MGVDFYSCANCGDTFCDAGYYFSCENCYEHFCSNECGGRQTAEEPENYEDNPGWEDQTTCILCRKEAVTDANMVQFLLKKAGLTYDEAVAMYRLQSEE